MMKIVIPTYQRPLSQATYKQLPEEWRRRTVFVVNQQDADRMRTPQYKDAEFVVIDCTTIAQKRAWIINNIECDSMVQLDDDLLFATRKYKDENKMSLVGSSKDEIDYWLKELEKMLIQYVHAGFSARQFNNNKPAGWVNTTRMMYSLGYQPKILRKECELGRIEYREDMDITLQLFRKGYDNVVCSEFCHDQTYNNPGGCSVIRTVEKSDEAAIKLAEYHPGIVKVVDKSYKDSVNRKEVICSWKKALCSV